MTIGDLVAIETLRTRVLSGASGADRRVSWAHSCELEDPWLWVGCDELLMTVGFCVPKDPVGQVHFVQELVAAGIAGATIGGRDEDLVLSAEMHAEADRLGFPLLRTEPAVPWSAISQHVAAAASSTQTSHVLTLARLYEVAAAASSPQDFVDELARLLDVQISVIDRETGLSLLCSASLIVGEFEEVRIRSHQFSQRHRAILEIGERAQEGLNSMVLVHLKRVIEVEVDRALLDAEADVTAQDLALKHLLTDGDSRGAEAVLGEGTIHSGCRLVAFSEETVEGVARLASIRGISVLVGSGSEHGIALVPSDELDRLRELLRELGIAAGVSHSIGSWGDSRGAVVEAASALADAHGVAGAWAEFAAARVGLLARSERESREIVREVLGPLSEVSDRAATLRETLFSYLRNDRSWARSSAELGVHRQTLAYRLRQAETLTGRSASRSEDISALWIAMQAWERFGADPDLG
ncbi:PucR family transcriptional regulator [Leucobacter coleopterorum]|uniref:PucR family transcriptional regulator n=1 Tax=Leucobacter coleopterorum TaxID=2714933 RepID=A0ABX6JYD4_9MICO|nr:PucR family transcriptional regulator [Leucobacter coleopterorum]QIM17780.1 PucR family transcriptional regulator [Leucobacter coleopterorum]